MGRDLCLPLKNGPTLPISSQPMKPGQELLARPGNAQKGFPTCQNRPVPLIGINPALMERVHSSLGGRLSGRHRPKEDAWAASALPTPSFPFLRPLTHGPSQAWATLGVPGWGGGTVRIPGHLGIPGQLVTPKAHSIPFLKSNEPWIRKFFLILD